VRLQRRRAILAAALTFTAAVAAIPWWITRATAPSNATSEVSSILIAPLRTTGSNVDPWSGAGLSDQIRTALRADGSLTVLRAEHPSTPVQGETAEASAQARVARRAGARFVVTGTLGRRDGKSEINLRLIRVSDASVAWSGTFWRSGDDLASAAVDLAREISEAVQIESRRSGAGGGSPPR
jgi:TolB-like protein